MPRSNYPVIVCLILLGLAVLVRTVAIAQRACDVLLPPLCEYRGSADIVIGHGPAGSSSAKPPEPINVGAAVNMPSILGTPSDEGPSRDVAAPNPREHFRGGKNTVTQTRAPRRYFHPSYGQGFGSQNTSKSVWPTPH